MRLSTTIHWLLLLSMTLHATHSLKVGVIGGGAAGLAAARVLSRKGISPVVLEKDADIGGVWRHVAGDKNRPMYQGLRTNLPREIMAFREKPWGSGPGKSYVTHKDVLQYLKDYKKDFDLDQYINYGCEVTQLVILKDSPSAANREWPQIELSWKQADQTTTEVFDAVCICNGHYSLPSSPQLPGIGSFSGKVMHSIEHDDPTVFKGQTVLCVGARASGSDVAREISQYAKHVYLSDSEATAAKTLDNLTWTPRTEAVLPKNKIQFAHDCSLSPSVDVIICCSGYDYSFPFINDKSQLDLTVGQRRVTPLYKQLWHAQHPSLTFLGLPHSVVPFPLFELQAEAVLAQFSDNKLPLTQTRMTEAEKDAVRGGSGATGRIQDTHHLGSAQWDYLREMAELAGLYDDKMENFIATNMAIYNHAGGERKGLFPGGPDTYRETRYVRDDENQSFVADSAVANGAMNA